MAWDGEDAQECGFGFQHVGEQDDPEDGLELIYEKAAGDFLAAVDR